MKKQYYVHTIPQANGDHEVHQEDCHYLPLPQNRIYLGEFTNCRQAVTAASAYYSDVDGCRFCSPECDTR
jgi:hypothetical protein